MCASEGDRYREGDNGKPIEYRISVRVCFAKQWQNGIMRSALCVLRCVRLLAVLLISVRSRLSAPVKSWRVDCMSVTLL